MTGTLAVPFVAVMGERNRGRDPNNNQTTTCIKSKVDFDEYCCKCA